MNRQHTMTVETTLDPTTGRCAAGVQQFLGARYGQPPTTGNLRLALPTPFGASTENYEATGFDRNRRGVWATTAETIGADR